MIPNSVKSIAAGAFAGCKNLSEITIPSGVTSIEEGTFSYCKNLKMISLPSSVTSIGNRAFNSCTSLTDINIPANVTRIGESAFSYCTSLRAINIPANVTSIGAYAFRECSGLTDIIIPTRVTMIGKSAFSDCYNLVNVTISSTLLSSLDDSVFMTTPWKLKQSGGVSGTHGNLTFTIDTDGNMVVRGNDVWKSVSECPELKQNMALVKSITFESGVTQIDLDYFYHFQHLEEIIIPETVSYIGHIAINCSSPTQNITKIVVDPNNPTYDSRDNCNAIIETATNTMIRGCSTTIIPDSVTTLGEECFKNGALRGDFVVPSNITSINKKAFHYNTALTSVTIPSSVINIEDNLFGFYTFPKIITCSNETKAYQYAQNNSITVEIPEAIIQEGVEATCTEAGKTEGKTCSICQEVFTSQEEIPAKGHTLVIDDKVDPTCENTGLTEGSHCSECKTVLQKQNSIDALGHSYSSEITTKATCEKDGVRTYTCSTCSGSYTESIPKKGHTTVVDSAVPATCEASGLTEGSHCSECKSVFKEQTSIDALGHSYSSRITTSATCERDGVRTYTCSTCFLATYTESIPKTGHQYSSETITKEATCTKKGEKTYFCTNCGENFTSDIEMIDHNYKDTIIAPTCIERGYTLHECKNCDASYKDTYLPMVDHDYEDSIVAPTCTNGGHTLHKCKNCDDSYKDQYTSKKGHTTLVDPVVPATCEASGLTEGSHCETCGVTLLEQTTVSATGHDYQTVTNSAQVPTCTTDGKKADQECSKCHDIITGDTISKTGHKIVIDPGYDATVTAKGKTKGSHCSVCGTITLAQKEIPCVAIVLPSKAPANNPISQDKSGIIGQTVASSDKKIQSTKADEVSGTVYQLLLLRVKTVKNNNLTIQWKQVAGATSYLVYGAKCGSNYKKLATVKTTSFTQNSLLKGTYYKYFVVALKGNHVMGTSKTVHIATSGAKVGNDKSISVKKKSVTLKKGKTFSIKTTTKVYSKKLKVKKHRAVCYESSDPSIAVVSSKGKITAKKKGVCYIYVFTQDGVSAKMKVTVK